MSARRAERTYALLLRAYPRPFRAAFGREMMRCFRDLLRDAEPPRLSFWLTIVADVARSAPALHAQALRARWSSSYRMEERRMKPMAILAVLIGLAQVVNGTVELVAGGATLGTLPRFAVLLAIALAILLVVAGVALLRRSPRATTLATLAAVAWLVLVVLTRAVYPWMSIFTMLLAIIFPLALLAFVWRSRGGSVATR